MDECLPDETLHAVLVISNPRMFKIRYKLFEECVFRLLKSSHVKIHVVECAFGSRAFHFEGRFPPEVDYIKVRTETEIWLKENLINIGVSKLPIDWKYVAWIDGDIQFVNPHWAFDTIHKLQHHPIVQMFSHVMDLGPHFEPLMNTTNETPVYVDCGFGYSYHEKLKCPDDFDTYGTFWHPGFAWAATREAWDTFGGLIDASICGAADHQQAWALIGQAKKTVHGGMPKAFEDYILQWEKNATPLHHRLGFVHGLILHYFHGKRTNRKYRERWNIMVDAQFDPNKHIKYDSQGLLQLCEPNSKLMRDLQIYFQQRDEDNPSI